MRSLFVPFSQRCMYTGSFLFAQGFCLCMVECSLRNKICLNSVRMPAPGRRDGKRSVGICVDLSSSTRRLSSLLQSMHTRSRHFSAEDSWRRLYIPGTCQEDAFKKEVDTRRRGRRKKGGRGESSRLSEREVVRRIPSVTSSSYSGSRVFFTSKTVPSVLLT